MSFLNHSSQCYNGNDLYASNKKENSNNAGVGILEFEDIFDDLDLQNAKRSTKKYEKNNSLHVPARVNHEDDQVKEKARTDTLQNQSSIHTFNENFPSSNNNFKKMNSFYSKALNLNRAAQSKEDVLLNPVLKKVIQTKETPLNSAIKRKKSDESSPKFHHRIPSSDEKISPSLKNFSLSECPQSSNEESQNIVNLIKHLSMANYPEKSQPKAIANREEQSNHFATAETFQQFLNSLTGNEIIKLPPSKVSLLGFRINKPVLIQGNVHSIMEITEGPIIVDLLNSNYPENKVVFSECNIVLEISKMKFSTSSLKLSEFFNFLSKRSD